MACTTILVGKKASYDGSTMIARNDDGFFDVKKLVIVEPNDQMKIYKSKISHLEIELPDNPMRYSSTPNVDLSNGIWAANGINEMNVAMTATETITSNPIVLGADPYVKYQKAKSKKEKDIPGGIGEEDLVVLVLPYITSAREGVIRLGELLEKYGTYEPNGIAFSDMNEIWWLETIGGHNWIARRVRDEEYVIMPNQFGLDRFSFEDAYGEQKENMCSMGLKELVESYHIDTNNNGYFNPRVAFGSHSDADHVYNTPRAWYMGRYFNPKTFKWDGDNADYSPNSDDIPWSFVPERKITIEDIKYILSSHYQGTPYDPYLKRETGVKGIYRPIGISRTCVMAILQIRDYVPSEIASIEWISFASNIFNASIPVYVNTNKLPSYYSSVSSDVEMNNLYWTSRILGLLADANYSTSLIHIERYQNTVAGLGHKMINQYDKKMMETNDFSLIDEANLEISKMAERETRDVLNKVIMDASIHMKNGYNRGDN